MHDDTTPISTPDGTPADVPAVSQVEIEADEENNDREVARLKELTVKGPQNSAEVVELACLMEELFCWDPDNDLLNTEATRSLAAACRRLYGGETPST